MKPNFILKSSCLISIFKTYGNASFHVKESSLIKRIWKISKFWMTLKNRIKESSFTMKKNQKFQFLKSVNLSAICGMRRMHLVKTNMCFGNTQLSIKRNPKKIFNMDQFEWQTMPVSNALNHSKMAKNQVQKSLNFFMLILRASRHMVSFEKCVIYCLTCMSNVILVSKKWGKRVNLDFDFYIGIKIYKMFKTQN